jgi:predicted MFS family arabinose efflux permease
MSEKSQHGLSIALWVSTIVILVLVNLQGFSGNWVTFFLILPGGTSAFGTGFIPVLVKLGYYHRYTGFAITLISILVLILAFLKKSTVYVRVFAVLGFVLTVVAAYGGYLFFTSRYEDRLALGQMADAFVGVDAAYFLQLFFMNRTPSFHFSPEDS